MTEKRSLQLPWSEVCDIVSAEIEKIMGTSIQCKAYVTEGEFWDIEFQNVRIPIAKLCYLLYATGGNFEDWENTIPDEAENDVGYTGMVLAEKLLGHGLNLTWEYHLTTEDSLWLLGASEMQSNLAGSDRKMDREHFAIQQVSTDRLSEIIESCSPQGLFLARDGKEWIAVDNSTFDAWTEEFSCKFQALYWLHGELETERSIERVYTVVHTAVDNDKCRFVSPMADVSYVSKSAAQEDMERQIAQERAMLDGRYDREERGPDYWEASQDGNETACFSRIEILETILRNRTEDCNADFGS